MEEIWRLFPQHLYTEIKQVAMNHLDKLEEIRLRVGTCVELIFSHRVIWLEHVLFTEKDSHYVLNQLSEHSLYRMHRELKEGYMTTKGGHRVGFAGAVTNVSEGMKQLQYITFFNIRIAKALQGVATNIIPFLKKQDHYYPTLIIGAPQTGKTTILRDLARIIGTGNKQFPALKVGIIDERSEIAASYQGIPQHDIGKRTDVMDACLKIDGLMMMIRSMSPEVLIADEIGHAKDVQALTEAMTAGVTTICTIHGDSLQTVSKRPSLQKMLDLRLFERFIILSKTSMNHFVYHIVNADGATIYQKEVSPW